MGTRGGVDVCQRCNLPPSLTIDGTLATGAVWTLGGRGSDEEECGVVEEEGVRGVDHLTHDYSWDPLWTTGYR